MHRLTQSVLSALLFCASAVCAQSALAAKDDSHSYSSNTHHSITDLANEDSQLQRAQKNQDGIYLNAQPEPVRDWKWKISTAYHVLTENAPDTVPPPGAIAVQRLSTEQIAAAPVHTLWRLGHSAVLLKLQGGLWLTDPQLGPRASPVSWAGPKRFHASPISAADLPPLAGVIISHNHYDHLDKASILALAAKTAVFVTPLGVGETLIGWGVPRERVVQLNWWQRLNANGVQVTATPAQHFSSRTLGDRNETLWMSCVIDDGRARIFFSGDGGYAPHFAQIGQKLGPFDVALLENGAYNERWRYFHMLPFDTLQAAIDLQAKWLVPVHNSTFRLARHPWYEPLERITTLAAQAQMPVSTPIIGAALPILQPLAGPQWWRTP